MLTHIWENAQERGPPFLARLMIFAPRELVPGFLSPPLRSGFMGPPTNERGGFVRVGGVSLP
jgi:hypothetical protein